MVFLFNIPGGIGFGKKERKKDLSFFSVFRPFNLLVQVPKDLSLSLVLFSEGGGLCFSKNAKNSI